MANNYTQFSEVYEISAAQAEVVETLADAVSKLDRADDDDPDRIAALRTLNSLGMTLDDLPESCTEFGELGFQFRISGSDPCELWVYADEYGDVDAVATILSAMLDSTGDDRILTGTWADWCSKPRVGEFSGGFWAASAERIDYGSAYSLAIDAKERMESARKGIQRCPGCGVRTDEPCECDE
jgi:hypothetical protein